MALKNLVIPRKTIAIPGGEMTVRGLSTDDITALLLFAPDDVENVISEVQSAGDDSAAQQAAVIKMASKFPVLVALAISLAADEPDEIENARLLPFPTQLEAVMAILDMTFSEPDALGKFVANLRGLFAKVRAAK
jgi:hypothetical protein